MRALRRYDRVLSELGMATALHAEGPEPYLACWMPDGPAPRTGFDTVERPADERTHAEERRAPALSR